VQIESTILCVVCQYTQYYAGREPGLHRGGDGRMPMGGRAAGEGARPWGEVGWIAGNPANCGAIGVDIWLQREYHCSVGTKEPRASRGAAHRRQKGD
jgi:hypothetical protein